jgi:hypothetical protein
MIIDFICFFLFNEAKVLRLKMKSLVIWQKVI